MLHLEALCTLFGKLPWHQDLPTVHCLGYLQQMKQDIEAAFGTCSLNSDGTISDEALCQVREATDKALETVLSYRSTVERQATKLVGPRNAPVHRCAGCTASLAILLRLAPQYCAAHGHRLAPRVLGSSPPHHIFLEPSSYRRSG